MVLAPICMRMCRQLLHFWCVYFLVLSIPFPDFRAFDVVSGLRGGEQALDVVSKMLAYDPLKRIKPLEVCSHEFVDEVCMTSARFIFCRF